MPKNKIDHRQQVDRATERTEFRFYLDNRRARYVYRMLGRLQLRWPVQIFGLALDYFWMNHPAGSNLHLLVDEKKRIYTVVEVLDNNYPRIVESDVYTGTLDSLLNSLRQEKYPDLVFGRANVLRREE